ncbi:MAG: efflux RND transporter permease subunit [Candidatus Methylacidiphilales bacterium]
MTLSDLSIKRPVFAWMLMAALIVFGAISLGRMGISQMPDIDFPVLDIRVTWEGAAPEFIETELVDQIEEKVIGVEGLLEIRSTIRQGAANIELEFSLDRDVDAALQEVQAALSQVRLPLNVEPPVIRKNSTENEPLMWIGITWPGTQRDLIAFCENFLVDQFQIIPGVGEVALGGYSERNLRIWIDNDKLRQFELTVLDVQRALANDHVELAAGYLENERQEINVRTMGEGLTAEEVSNILITTRGGQPIYDTAIRIGDVARVEDGLSEIRRIARINGLDQAAVSLGIRKQRGSNEIEIGERVKAKLAELKPMLPEGMETQVNVDFTRFARQSVYYTQKELVIAAILTAFICYLFLGSWTSALNVILSIPTSIIGTFTILYFMGFTLNTFTLLGLALAIGIVVDDSIMVLENIVRHFGMGKGKKRAARDGAREITFAAVAATVAVIAIFLPVAFMQGIIGKYFFQFGVTITAAVALSLLEAITLTPMRCSQLLRPNPHPNLLTRAVDRGFSRLAEGYWWALGGAMKARWGVLIAATVLFGLSLLVYQRLRVEFVPPQDQNFVRIFMQTPVGSSIAATDAKAREVEAILQDIPEVERFFVSVGGITGVPNQAFAAVTFVEKDQRTMSQEELIQLLRKKFSQIEGLRATIQDLSTRGLTPRRSQPVEFNLRGLDYQELDRASVEIMRRLDATGLVTDLDSSYRAGMPELRIIPDRQAAALRGVTMAEIGRTINAAIGGLREGKFSNDGRRYDVRLRLEPDERLTPEDVKRLQVRTTFGELIPLADVVRLEEVPTVQTVNRINRQRAVSVTANLAPGVSQAAALAEAERISREVLPPGYSFNLEGGAQTFSESFATLQFTLILGVIIAYMVLAAQFNSFIHPLTVLLALPFSLTGALLALWFTDHSISLFSGIGIILLMGIAKKNSILLVEFANQIRERDRLSSHESMLRAAPIRLRPILMTSLATIGAAIPLALSTGAGSETRVPMAVTVIGGMVVSTAFTLFVVPCAFSLLSRWELRKTEAEIAEDEAELRSDYRPDTPVLKKVRLGQEKRLKPSDLLRDKEN